MISLLFLLLGLQCYKNSLAGQTLLKYIMLHGNFSHVSVCHWDAISDVFYMMFCDVCMTFRDVGMQPPNLPLFIIIIMSDGIEIATYCL